MAVIVADIPLWLSITGITLGTAIIILGAVAGILVLMMRREVTRLTQAGIAIRKGPESANYRGHASLSIPVKGNGVLALTDTEVRFVRLLPRSEFTIPLAQITRLEHHRTWKGSTRAGHQVLVIQYQDGALQDAVGFIVRDLDDWSAALAHAAQVLAP